MSELKPCPFCEKHHVHVVVCDDEGNVHGDIGCEYESDHWSGLSYGLVNRDSGECKIAEEDDELIGTYLYDTIEEATAAWNTRYERTCQMERHVQYDGGDVAMKCLSCGFETTDSNAKYCPECGAKVEEASHE